MGYQFDAGKIAMGYVPNHSCVDEDSKALKGQSLADDREVTVSNQNVRQVEY